MNNPMKSDHETEKKLHQYEIKWLRVILYLYFHLAGLYGIYCLFFANWKTILFTLIMIWLTGIGVVGGAHRLWSHKTYKAKLPLQIFLMICHSIANQNTVINWAKDHRLHHKFSDTDLDPHNSTRGFFYSHIGWLLVNRKEEIKKAGRMLVMVDLLENPVLVFQKRHAKWLILLMAFVVPTLIPKFWHETFSIAYNVNMLRFIYTLNATFTVNSFAHKWGNKPYDKTIVPCESLPATFMSLGEGYHNYHHTFPQDYRAAELGNYMLYFIGATGFIDFCAWIGLVYDRKTVSEEVLRARVKRTGDEMKEIYGVEKFNICEKPHDR